MMQSLSLSYQLYEVVLIVNGVKCSINISFCFYMLITQVFAS